MTVALLQQSGQRTTAPPTDRLRNRCGPPRRRDQLARCTIGGAPQLANAGMHDPVLITNPARPRDHGSGFVIRRLAGDAAQVVTCAHVVRTLGADGLQVAGQPATVVVDLAAQGVDLAVLAVAGLTEPGPLALARGTVGDRVELLGFEPAGGGPLAVPHRGVLAKSSLTALGGKNRPAWHLQLDDGDIEGGHSGGPVIDVRTGKVVGVIAMGPEQKGGRDGVAVAIENLAVWADAPTIAPARPPTSDPAIDPDADPSGSIKLPGATRGIPWRWVAIVGGSLAAAVGVAAVAWPSTTPTPTPAPSGCAIPDLRDGFKDRDVEAWCPDAIVETTPCVGRFDDGSVITGTCAGTRAIRDWRSVDPAGIERSQAHFDDAGAPTGTWIDRATDPSGAAFTSTTRYRVPVTGNPGQVRTTRVEEWRCHRPAGGDTTITHTIDDLASSDERVTLSVAGRTFDCTAHAGAPVRCFRSTFPVDPARTDVAWSLLREAEEGIKRCQDVTLPVLPTCGDREVNIAGEECDDGGPSSRCTAACKLSRCGDGVVNPAAQELCDPGERGESASCNSDCTPSACGDNKPNRSAGEVCDSPAKRGTRTCDADCTAPRCGDGLLNLAAGEQCDDGARDTATCLHLTCKTSRCGDKIVNAAAGEECDAGARDSATCLHLTCKRSRCGDGIVNAAANEQCDGGPGCGADCKRIGRTRVVTPPAGGATTTSPTITPQPATPARP